MPKRIIAHIDLDAFFASVEEREKPYLRGAPLVIGADPKGGEGRGVVSTASYPARAYGVKSAMPITKAWRLCEEARGRGEPPCVFLSPYPRKYGAASREVFKIVYEYTERIEQVSVDEAYLDFSHYKSFGGAAAVAKQMQEAILGRTQLTCSIGIGPSKLIAKLASERRKPRGLTVVTPDKVDRFLKPLPLQAIPGIGPKAMERFARRRIKTIRDARALSWEELGKMFGTWGFGVYERLRGIDDRDVETEHEDAKSIGKHTTFDEDTFDMEEIFTELAKQSHKIVKTMRGDGFRGFRTVVLTIRFADFETLNRSLTIKEPLNTAAELELKGIKLALPFFDSRENPRKKKIRLVGLRIEKLE